MKDKDRTELDRLFMIAKELGVCGGHITIFKFTTHWKAMIGTPDLDTGNGRKEVKYLREGKTIEDAVANAIAHKIMELNSPF